MWCRKWREDEGAVVGERDEEAARYELGSLESGELPASCVGASVLISHGDAVRHQLRVFHSPGLAGNDLWNLEVHMHPPNKTISFTSTICTYKNIIP